MYRFRSVVFLGMALASLSCSPTLPLCAQPSQGTVVKIDAAESIKATVWDQINNVIGKVISVTMIVGGLIGLKSQHPGAAAIGGVGGGLGVGWATGLTDNVFTGVGAATLAPITPPILAPFSTVFFLVGEPVFWVCFVLCLMALPTFTVSLRQRG